MLEIVHQDDALPCFSSLVMTDFGANWPDPRAAGTLGHLSRRERLREALG
jgi:hypothetical protein